jgi:hypothetical protein
MTLAHFELLAHLDFVIVLKILSWVCIHVLIKMVLMIQRQMNVWMKDLRRVFSRQDVMGTWKKQPRRMVGCSCIPAMIG